MKAKNFDKKFDAGEDEIVADLDLSTTVKPNQNQKRVNVDFPIWMIESLDREASRIGVTRQSIIKLWLSEKSGVTAITLFVPEKRKTHNRFGIALEIVGKIVDPEFLSAILSPGEMTGFPMRPSSDCYASVSSGT